MRKQLQMAVIHPAQPEVNEPVEETWLLLEYCDHGSLMVGCFPG